MSQIQETPGLGPDWAVWDLAAAWAAVGWGAVGLEQDWVMVAMVAAALEAAGSVEAVTVALADSGWAGPGQEAAD